MEKYPNGTTVPNLATQVLLPTPTKLMPDNSATREVKVVNGKYRTENKNGYEFSANSQTLASAMMLPTPRANDKNHPKTQGKGFTHTKERGYCAEVVIDKYLSGMLPTPSARDWKDSGDPKKLAERNITNQESLPRTIAGNVETDSLKLNPLFIMEMMGFPITWTLMPFLKDRPEVHEGLFYDEGWNNFPISNPLCPKLNKDDFEDITTSKWRNESIKAGGNAIVPQVALQIFKVIQKIENE